MPAPDDAPVAPPPEAVLDPERPVIDSHHHLYDRPGLRYLFDDYRADLASGHDLRGSVFVQARSMLRAEGPERLRSLGEVEFANGVAAMSASGTYGPARLCAGIVGHADLTQGAIVRELLERMIQAAGGTTRDGGRFCGIRQPLCRDADRSLLNPMYPADAEMIRSAPFREGFAQLAPLGLSFDVWAFFHQLPEIAALARAFPETRIIVDHCGGILGRGAYAGDRTVFDQWRRGIRLVAACDNVVLKLSGLGMPLCGFGFDTADAAPGSPALAAAWAPWVETCLDAFGADRCLYGSNFPVDRQSHGFSQGLNAMKRLTAGASDAEKDAIFWGTAQRVYGLSLVAGP